MEPNHTPRTTPLPLALQSDFASIVAEIRSGQQKTLQSVNRELILLY